MASGVAYVIIKRKRRKLALLFVKEALKDQAPLVQRVDSTAHWIKHYPLNNSIYFVRCFPVDSGLSAKKRFLTFEQPGPGLHILFVFRSEMTVHINWDCSLTAFYLFFTLNN